MAESVVPGEVLKKNIRLKKVPSAMGHMTGDNLLLARRLSPQKTTLIEGIKQFRKLHIEFS